MALGGTSRAHQVGLMAVFPPVLSHDAHEVRPTRDPDRDRRFRGHPVDLAEYLLILLGRDLVVNLAPAGGHQHEDVPRFSADVHRQVAHGRQVVPGLAHHRGVELEAQPGFSAGDQTLHRRVKRTGHTPDRIVPLGRRAVNADRNAPHARLFQLAHRLGRDERAVGGDGHPQPPLGAVGGDLEDVGPHQWFAAADDKDGLAELGQLVNQSEDLFRRQFIWLRRGLGAGPAVHAGQVASHGGFPGHDAEAFDVQYRLHRSSTFQLAPNHRAASLAQ